MAVTVTSMPSGNVAGEAKGVGTELARFSDGSAPGRLTTGAVGREVDAPGVGEPLEGPGLCVGDGAALELVGEALAAVEAD